MIHARHLLGPVLPVVLLALAACTEEAGGEVDPRPSETAIPVEPDSGIGDGAQPPARVVATIPEAYHGVWDRAGSGCEPHSLNRTEIGPDTIGFYESQGTVSAVEIGEFGRITVSMEMEGEGETWRMERGFALTDGGRTLTASPVGEEEFDPVHLERCDN